MVVSSCIVASKKVSWRMYDIIVKSLISTINIDICWARGGGKFVYIGVAQQPKHLDRPALLMLLLADNRNNVCVITARLSCYACPLFAPGGVSVKVDTPWSSLAPRP